ncbi:endonuclease NucS domain-containing protein [Streptomyces sp. NBC_00842]|uniref:endonuclease NucS domain-containing protein n=1 Tax=unclassified Streptomyces TaxID=2593676 RepID=UPI003870B3EB
MTAPYEEQLRDELSHSLSLIEQGLRLIGTEYPVPNANGTRGRIDILARDAHGSWVVIELKRADGTARQALHEVTKYTELLREELGIRQDRIRAVIVSTTWRELLTPVSNMVRDWSHDLRGYALHLDSDGKPARAERVTFLPEPVAPRVTPHHFIYFYNSPEDRDLGWQEIIGRAEEAGGTDLLAANFRRVRDVHLVRAPFGLYFAIGAAEPRKVPEWIKEECEDPDMVDPHEYEILCHITKHVFAADYDSARPGLLRELHEDPHWDLEGYRTAGAFAKRAPLDDRDLLRDLNGDDEGIGEILYDGSARTTDRGRWPALLKESTRSLGGNPSWEHLTHAWLADVAQQDIESEVHLHVYNPCDLIHSLLLGWPDDIGRRVPMLSAVAIAQGDLHRSLSGQLFWDGREVPDVAGRVRNVYPEPLLWGIAKSTGAVWDTDLQLVDALGLHYILVDRIEENPLRPSESDTVSAWKIHEGSATRIPAPFHLLREQGWLGIYPLAAFIEAHRDQLDALVKEFRRAMAYPSM